MPVDEPPTAPMGFDVPGPPDSEAAPTSRRRAGEDEPPTGKMAVGTTVDVPTVDKMPSAPAGGVEDVAATAPLGVPVFAPPAAPELELTDETAIAVMPPHMVDDAFDGSGVRAGQILAGKYRVERILGRGGMGVVVAARHLQLDEKVALKFLLPEALESTYTVGRFLQEARAAVKIKGEHVARVSDVGQLENGSPFIVMEYLEGVDLSAWLQHRGPLAIEQAVDFVLQACEAIADAHALGIVHRDLKPANLFCVRRSDGQFSIKVLDFGISKFTAPGKLGHVMTGTSSLVGSPFYMSPEQMQLAKSVDTRTDIWALGIILFELLTGRPPFESEAATDLAIKVATEPTPPARAFRPDVPPGLERVIETCLAKDRNARFPSIAELAVALKDFGSKQSKVSIERVLGTLRQAGISGAVLPPSGEYASMRAAPSSPPARTMADMPTSPGQLATPARASRITSVLWVAIVVLTVVLVVAAVLLWRQSPRSYAPPASTPSSAPSRPL